MAFRLDEADTVQDADGTIGVVTIISADGGGQFELEFTDLETLVVIVEGPGTTFSIRIGDRTIDAHSATMLSVVGTVRRVYVVRKPEGGELGGPVSIAATNDGRAPLQVAMLWMRRGCEWIREATVALGNRIDCATCRVLTQTLARVVLASQGLPDVGFADEIGAISDDLLDRLQEGLRIAEAEDGEVQLALPQLAQDLLASFGEFGRAVHEKTIQVLRDGEAFLNPIGMLARDICQLIGCCQGEQ